MKGTIKDWLKVGILLLDEAVVVGLVILVLWVFKIRIPLPVVIIVALLLGALIFVIHKAIIPSFHQSKVTGAEGLIGHDGKVIEPLTPTGVVYTMGEYWKAKSLGEHIVTGEEVEIIGLNGLTLAVKRKNLSCTE